MMTESITKSILTSGWLPRNQTTRGMRSPHLWIITALMVFGILLYYADLVLPAGIPPFTDGLSIIIHDLHRTMFFIPIIYASLVFRTRGSLITSFIFLCIVLPRALLISPYPDALLRPLVFVTFAAFISLLIATQLNRVEKEIRTGTELKAAYQELNESRKRLAENQEQLIQAERLSLIGEMAASFTHEVKNPLAAAMVFNKLLTKEVAGNNFSKETSLKYLSQIDLALTRSIRLIENMLNLGRQSPPSLKLVDINSVINRALELTVHLTKGQDITVITEFNPSLPRTMADSDQLQQVYINLTLNAIQAMTEGGRLTIRTSADENWLKTEIEDTGCGISLENMSKLFKPFFTTKEKGRGVGLGLAVCHEIIQHHEGRIEVQSKEGEGTTFSIYLPVHLEEYEGEVETPEKDRASRTMANVQA